MRPEMRVVAVGAHVLDVLACPVEEIPQGQGGALLDAIRVAPAGTAGGTAVILAKLGARVLSAGAVGDDALADLLIGLLRRHGVDTSALVRRDGVQTSASVLPIRADGSRPALHVLGANVTLAEADIPWAELEGATHVHLGAPELLDAALAHRILKTARAAGAVTSVDFLAPGDFPGVLEIIAPLLPLVDHVLPNDEQVLGYTGAEQVEAGCRTLLAQGAGCVAATCGAAGAVVVSAAGVERVPAHAIDVVDTSGCGDAFSAGYLRALALQRTPAEAAALGCAVAALVAQGLGTDHGDFDLAAAERFAAEGPVRAAATSLSR